MRIDPFRMSPAAIAETVLNRYGAKNAEIYLTKQVSRAGMAGYGQRYQAALQIVKNINILSGDRPAWKR